MANVAPTPLRVPGQGGLDGFQVIWTPLTTTNTTGLPVGSPIGDGASAVVPAGASGFFAGFADKSVAITGTFQTSVAATLVLEGSLDGTNFFTLTNPLGTAASFTSAGTTFMMAITEAVIMVRPRISTGGDAGTSLTVTMFFRKTQTP